MLLSLLDNLDTGRVEVDYVYVEGPDLEWVDNRLLNLMLVSNDMTPAIMFDPTGKVQQPGELLYKKNVIVLRGYFRPINNLGMEFMEDSLANFKRDEDYRPDNTIAFCEISLKYLIRNEKVDDKDFLHRVDLLNMMGQSVMVSKFYRYFQLVKYFAQFRLIKLRLVVGLPTFDKILDPSNYTDLRGGLLEAMGALFQENVKIYLYPYLDMTTGKVVYPEDSYFSETNRMLWQYLNATKKILVLKSIHPKSLEIHSEYISALIEKGDESLINYVPEKVCQSIKRKKLFGYKRNTSQEVLDV